MGGRISPHMKKIFTFIIISLFIELGISTTVIGFTISENKESGVDTENELIYLSKIHFYVDVTSGNNHFICFPGNIIIVLFSALGIPYFGISLYITSNGGTLICNDNVYFDTNWEIIGFIGKIGYYELPWEQGYSGDGIGLIINVL